MASLRTDMMDLLPLSFQVTPFRNGLNPHSMLVDPFIDIIDLGGDLVPVKAIGSSGIYIPLPRRGVNSFSVAYTVLPRLEEPTYSLP